MSPLMSLCRSSGPTYLFMLASVLVAFQQVASNHIPKQHHEISFIAATTSAPSHAHGVSSSIETTTAPVLPALETVAHSTVSPVVRATIETILTAVPMHSNQTAKHDSATHPHVGAESLVEHSAVGRRLKSYFMPICDQVDKLSARQLFKIQAQLKQFMEKTAGKMSVCFMKHFSIDPNLIPVTKEQISKICLSCTLPETNEASFKQFETCAEQNWDKSLDLELDRINSMRLNCVKNHTHSKTDPSIFLLHDNDDEAIINEVVGKVLSDNRGFDHANITLIDVGRPARFTNNSASSNNSTQNKRVLNDPNTLLVLVDEINTTLPPAKHVSDHHNASATHHNSSLPHQSTPMTNHIKLPHVASNFTTLAPAANNVTSARNATHMHTTLPSAHSTHHKQGPHGLDVASPTSKPEHGNHNKTSDDKTSTAEPSSFVDKILSAIHSTVGPKNEGHGNSSGKHHPNGTITVNPHVTVPKPKPDSSSAHTGVDLVKKSDSKMTSSTFRPTTEAPTNTTSVSSNSTTKAPTSPEHKSKEGKKELDESDQKEVERQKKKDETDAKNAIKSLQSQRNAGHSDARLHQIEHERQMSIDPVGHTAKHEQYEKMKRARMTSTMAPESF